jgi:hypothetical protein
MNIIRGTLYHVYNISSWTCWGIISPFIMTLAYGEKIANCAANWLTQRRRTEKLLQPLPPKSRVIECDIEIGEREICYESEEQEGDKITRSVMQQIISKCEKSLEKIVTPTALMGQIVIDENYMDTEQVNDVTLRKRVNTQD